MKLSQRAFPGLPNPDQGRVATQLARLRSLPAQYYEAREDAFRPVEPDGWFDTLAQSAPEQVAKVPQTAERRVHMA